MRDKHIIGYLVEAGDHVAARGAGRVTGAGHHDGHSGARVPVEAHAPEPAGIGRDPRATGGGRQQLQQTVFKRGRVACLRVAEARVELQHPRSVLSQHQAGVEHAVKLDSAAAKLIQHRLVRDRRDAEAFASSIAGTGE